MSTSEFEASERPSGEPAPALPTMGDLHALSDDLDSIDQTLAELEAE
ncbi:MAG: hypothetical protein R2706_15950 [Acidimicrobiales bacterium]